MCLFIVAVSHSRGSELCVTVVDPTDAPLPKVKLLLIAAGADATVGETDEKGSACLEIRRGSYSLELVKRGFVNVRYDPVRVTPIRSRRLTMRMPIGYVAEGGLDEAASIMGVVDSAELGRVEVCLASNQRNSVPVCKKSDATGEFGFTVKPGHYTLQASDGKGRKWTKIVDAKVGTEEYFTIPISGFLD